ncbi:MAG: right-handed parallel beta-helix repeat-containing protein, partial [Bacteroidales bacterium]|nr:right-handed parallel beta-helix repeat-containing protein [Bacteroidales bacterium]
EIPGQAGNDGQEADGQDAGDQDPVEIPEGYMLLSIIGTGDGSQAGLSQVSARTTIAADGSVSWVKDDEIDVLWDGGSTTAGASSTGASTSFRAIVPKTGELYGVYPASSASLSSDVLKVTVPATQDGHFASANLALARVNRSTKSAAFHNVGAVMKLTVSNASVRRIVIDSADGSTCLSGSYNVSFDSYSVAVDDFSDAYSDGGTRITMDVDGAGDYYVALVPGVTLDGFVVTYYTSDGSTYTALTPYHYTGTYATAIGKVKNFGDLNPNPGHLYVSVDGSGTKSGFTAANAMDFARWKSRVSAIASGAQRSAQAESLNGVTFHFAAGTYSFLSTTPFALGGYGQVGGNNIAFTLQGVSGTIFSGEKSDAAYGKIFNVSSGVELLLDGITFTKANASSNLAGACLEIASGAIVRASDCTFSSNTGNPVYTTGTAYFTTCSFSENSSEVAYSSLGVKANNGGSVTISGCDFTMLSAGTNSAIGAIYAGTSASVIVQDSGSTHTTFTDITATSNNSGALVSYQTSGVLSVTNAVFSGNSGNFGVGTYLRDVGINPSFTGCTWEDNEATSGNGGAIHINSGSNTPRIDFTGCEFTGNSADAGGYGGGAIYISDCPANVRLSGCTFEDNSATNGGALFSLGSGTVILTGSNTFTGNTATIDNSIFTKPEDVEKKGGGGAFSLRGASCLTVTDGVLQTFSANHADKGFGGAVELRTSGTTNFAGCTFSGNYTDTSVKNNDCYCGGAVCANGSGTYDFSNCLFSSNHTKAENITEDEKYNGDYGGAVDVRGNATARFNQCIFDNNYAHGGGAFHLKSSSATTYLNACVFSRNHISYRFGTTIVAYDNAGVLCMNNCTFADNTYGPSVQRGKQLCWISLKLGSGDALLMSNNTLIGNLHKSSGLNDWSDARA